MDNVFKSLRRQFFDDADIDVTITVNDTDRKKMHLIEEAVDELFDKVQDIVNASTRHTS